ncbi:hypothetical protein LMG28727_06396 [Paraburkholderia kirstenboschensis]|nr:hypothetical protein LMG28727_06396 [Paraburkholderia kirstenboschensis]
MILYTEEVMPQKTEHWSRLYGTRMTLPSFDESHSWVNYAASPL